MKNFIALSILLSFALMSCDKGKTAAKTSAETNDSIKKIKKFEIDSISINDSMKIDDHLSAAVQAKILVFPSIKNKNILDSIYAPIDIRLEEYGKENLTLAVNQKTKEFYDQQFEAVKDWSPDIDQTWYNNSDMKVFSNTNDYLTLQYTVDGYGGGAHGYYNETYKVFDLKNNKTMQVSDVISNQNTKLWNTILMDNFLKNDSENGQAEMLLVQNIPINNNFYFDKKNLYFLYNQYEITAYAAGPVLIKIPLSDIKLLLTDEFIARQDL